MTNSSKILLICHLTDSKCNGQVAKTLDTYNYLKEKGYEVDILNYGEFNAFQKILCSRKIVKRCDRVVLMPGGRNALFYYSNLLLRLKKKNIHYVAIGGWVLSLLNNKKFKKQFEKLKKFKGIYLQNKATQNRFIEEGFDNTFFVSNFSSKKPLSQKQFDLKNQGYDKIGSFKFCFFARVERTKGVLLACDAINQICQKFKNINISLDIYGEIKDKTLENELNQICKSNPAISVKGVLGGDDVIKQLSTYYCMLFPTFYRGEGTPHSVMESFMAGLPVIASNWAYNSEIVDDNKTGLLFELNTNELFEKIEWAINNPIKIKEFSKNCFTKSKEFNKEKSLEPLLKNLE